MVQLLERPVPQQNPISKQDSTEKKRRFTSGISISVMMRQLKF